MRYTSFMPRNFVRNSERNWTRMEHSVAQRLDEGFRRVLVGTDGPIFAALVALFGGGHLLVEGVPGTAKTLLVRTLARLIGGSFRRIQFTPDLMPADVIGTTTFDPRSAQFSLRVGPISANVVLADEINRTPPKTQSALLEAMEERQVTIDGNRIAMPAPFIVAATQNPIEFEGTYPLPEAQLDRFMVKTTTDYPSAEQERDLLARANAGFDALDLDAIQPVATLEEIRAAQAHVRTIHVAPELIDYLYAVVARTRNTPELALGASPRAAISLLSAMKCAAFLDDRTFATPDDCKATAAMVLGHRMIVQPEAEIEGIDTLAVIARILAAVPVPVIAAS